MEVGEGPNWGCSAKGKKNVIGTIVIIEHHLRFISLGCNVSYETTEKIGKLLTSILEVLCLNSGGDTGCPGKGV
jgi:hypothetical protein